MKFALKTIAAAVALTAAVGAHAAIDTGSTGNGELFFNIWDANGSYTFDLNKTIDSFQSDVAASGAIDQSYALSNFGTFLAGVADTSVLKFNLVAADKSGAYRLLTTFTVANSPTTTNDSIRTVTNNVNAFATAVNGVIGANDSVAVNNGSAAWAGKTTFKDNPGGILGFSNAGTLANNSYDMGVGFMRIDALSLGSANSTYVPYSDGSPVHVWVDTSDSTLHIAAAVPEPESYAMLLAGLGMIGVIARRRRAK